MAPLHFEYDMLLYIFNFIQTKIFIYIFIYLFIYFLKSKDLVLYYLAKIYMESDSRFIFPCRICLPNQAPI